MTTPRRRPTPYVFGQILGTGDTTELESMREILSQAGYRPADAKRLQGEGMGPSELEYRLRERGGLERTHGLRKRATRHRSITPFGARAAKSKFTVGRMAKVVRFVPGYPVGIPTDAFVDVAEVSRVSGARGKISIRIRVEYRGNSYWVDEDQLAPLG